MKHYSLKSHSKTLDYMTILSESDEGFMVKIVRDKDGYQEVVTDFISRELFESCLRTGYIKLIEDETACIATA